MWWLTQFLIKFHGVTDILQDASIYSDIQHSKAGGKYINLASLWMTGYFIHEGFAHHSQLYSSPSQYLHYRYHEKQARHPSKSCSAFSLITSCWSLLLSTESEVHLAELYSFLNLGRIHLGHCWPDEVSLVKTIAIFIGSGVILTFMESLLQKSPFPTVQWLENWVFYKVTPYYMSCW